MRQTPLKNAFSYRSYSWFVDVDRLPELPWPLRPLAVFRAADHLGDPAATIRGKVERYLRTRGMEPDGGAIRMLANARVFGHVFNPLTLFWCYRQSGELQCVIAEVHNTYGERHCYLLDRNPPAGPVSPRRSMFHRSTKLNGQYHMMVPAPGERLSVSIVLDREGHRPFVATMDGSRRPAADRNILAAASAVPAATLLVSALIRIQGIRLWARRLPVVKRPHHPSQEAVQ